jgi:hypothetical protein
MWMQQLKAAFAVDSNVVSLNITTGLAYLNTNTPTKLVGQEII